MATKFKPGDIVKITKVDKDSAWYDDSDIKNQKLKLKTIRYLSDSKSYSITATILEGIMKNRLLNDSITIYGCKLKYYDK